MTGALRAAATAAFVVSAVAVVALHALRPGLDPASHRLSEYAVGPYGWLMVVAFGALALGTLALGVALRGEAAPAWAWAGCFFVAAASLLSGMFDVEGASEPVHSLASTGAVVGATGLLCGSAFRPWAGHRSAPRLLAIAAAVLLVLGPAIHRTTWTGAGQRALWMLLLTGLIWIAQPVPAVERSR